MQAKCSPHYLLEPELSVTNYAVSNNKYMLKQEIAMETTLPLHPHLTDGETEAQAS
jgi:hypothetical protein